MFDALKDLLFDATRRHRIDAQVDAARVCDAYHQVRAGLRIPYIKQSEAVYVKRRVLYVRVPNHGLSQELLYHRQTIIKKVHQHIGRACLEDIRFII